MHALPEGKFERAVKPHRRLLAARFAALQSMLEEVSPEGASAVSDLRTFLGDVAVAGVDDLLAEATPFFWLNVDRCLAAILHQDSDTAPLVPFMLNTAFDSLFNFLPDGSTFELAVDQDEDLVLPKLGVRIPASQMPVKLRRDSAGSLVMTTPAGVTEIPSRSANRPAPLTDPRVDIGTNVRARILLEPGHGLVDPVSALSCERASFDVEPFRAMMKEALDLISAANPETAGSIDGIIDWYVPVRTKNPEVHRSFTIERLTGVIFLSEALNHVLLAEAIVHEFYHTVLHIVSETEEIFPPEDRGERFYSPWRDDPRPLSGLLHALYVFSGVAEFYLRAGEVLADRPGNLVIVRHRRAKLHRQLHLGLAQVPKSRLPETAGRIIEAIEGRLKQHPPEPDASVTEAVESHRRAWIERNPDLAPQLRTP